MSRVGGDLRTTVDTAVPGITPDALMVGVVVPEEISGRSFSTFASHESEADQPLPSTLGRGFLTGEPYPDPS